MTSDVTSAKPTTLPGTMHPLGVDGNIVPRPVGFDPADPACFSRTNRGTLVFRTTAPSDVARAYVAVEGGFEEGAPVLLGYPMELVGRAGAITFWSCEIEPEEPSIEYTLAFELANGSAAYWGTTGLTTSIERLERFEAVVDAVVSHDVPEWARGMVLYQIFPDRFANGDDSLTPPDAERWDTPPTRTGFKGGDLVGIRKQLDYLADLGVDALYLNPIFTSPSNHKYDTADYYEVDPAFGGGEALHELVAEAHGRGMRIILDVSLNHAHPRYAPFADVIARGEASEYAGWFIVHDYPPRLRVRPPERASVESRYWTEQIPRIEQETELIVEEADDVGPAVETTYDAWFGVPTMPRIELQNPSARQAMIDVATHWIAEHDVDGWRMDVVRYVDPDVWVDLRQQVHAVTSDAYLLAEVAGDSQQWLQGDMFDATMNYTFRQLCVDYFATDVITTEQLLEGLLRMLAMYSPAVTGVNHNLIGSHDKERFLTVAEDDEDRLLLATILQLTIPGAPGLYYGDEIAMAGGPDPDNRRAFEWDRVGNDHYTAVRALLHLRRTRPELRFGDFRLRSEDALIFERSHQGTSTLVAINHGDQPLRVEAGHLLWSHGEVSDDEGAWWLATGAAFVAERPA